MPLGSPFSSLARVVSGWGDSRAYRGGFHEGIDLLVPVGTPVLAIAAGTAVNVQHDACSSAAGKHVAIEHTDRRFRTTYMHLSRVDIRHGQSVTRGQVLGLSGRSGGDRSGPDCTFGVAPDHLHLTLRQRTDQIPRGLPTGGVAGAYTSVPAEPHVPARYEPDVVAKLARYGLTPAIAAGGGILFLALIGGGIWWYLRRSS